MQANPTEVSLSPIAHSLNTSVQDHRRLLDILSSITEYLGDCHCAVWLPVFDANCALAALYEAAASQAPTSGWALHTPSMDRGTAPALDAFMRGDLTTDSDGDRQHVPIFGCDGEVRLVMSLSRTDAEDGDGSPFFASPEEVYRAVGRSGLLELAAECAPSRHCTRALNSHTHHTSLDRSRPVCTRAVRARGHR